MANIEKLFKDFNFRSFNIKRDYPRALYTYGSPGTASYYDNTKEVVEMEIGLRDLENLADTVHRADYFLNKEGYENYLRSKHPAIADAYSKYQMLLELCR